MLLPKRIIALCLFVCVIFVLTISKARIGEVEVEYSVVLWDDEENDLIVDALLNRQHEDQKEAYENIIAKIDGYIDDIPDLLQRGGLYTIKGTLYYFLNQDESAMACFEEALIFLYTDVESENLLYSVLESENSSIILARGCCSSFAAMTYMRNENYERAIFFFEKILEEDLFSLSWYNKTFVQNGLAYCHSRLGEDEVAEDILKLILTESASMLIPDERDWEQLDYTVENLMILTHPEGVEKKYPQFSELTKSIKSNKDSLMPRLLRIDLFQYIEMDDLAFADFQKVNEEFQQKVSSNDFTEEERDLYYDLLVYFEDR